MPERCFPLFFVDSKSGKFVFVYKIRYYHNAMFVISIVISIDFF